jgi:ferredoxin, 2Fe-2S
MAKLRVVTLDREERVLDGTVGLTVMQIIRGAGIDDMLALCGGNCACGTCHVYVDPAYIDRLPVMKENEDDLLEGSRHRIDASRLPCQIVFSEALDGLKVTIAPYD